MATGFVAAPDAAMPTLYGGLSRSATAVEWNRGWSNISDICGECDSNQRHWLDFDA